MRTFYLLFGFLALCAESRAQLPVGREPHHKVVLDNRYLRLLEGNIPAGDTTTAHLHSANSLVVFLSPSTFGIRVVGDKPVITTVKAGDTKYAAYGDKPVDHIVWNQGPGPFHFFVVETKQKAIADTTIHVGPGKSVYLPPVTRARLLIALPSDKYRFFPPGTPVNLDNAGTYLVVEIK